MASCYFCGLVLQATDTVCSHCGQPQVLRNTYRLTELIGQGGFGMVYAASDLRMTRRYAVKIMPVSQASQQRQIETEANLLAQYAAQFAFMPDIYDLWSEGAQTVLVMEYIDGDTLDQTLLQRGSWAARQVEELLRAMLDALQQLHAVGIIHRDIKPENIKRTTQGRYVLLDFGIAKQHGATMTVAKAGSVYYSSPEQLRGDSTDARSDLYSLGATAYHLLTGQTPTPAMLRTAGTDLPLPAGTPAAVARVLTMLTQVQAQRRPASATTALALLDTPVPSSAGQPTVALTHVRPHKPLPPMPPKRQSTTLWEHIEDWIDQGKLTFEGVRAIAILLAVLILLCSRVSSFIDSKVNVQQRLDTIGQALDQPAPTDSAPIATLTPQPIHQPTLPADLPTHTLENGVQIIEITQGEGDEVANNEYVTIRYGAYIGTARVNADSTTIMSFRMGSGTVGAGLESGVTGMQVGGKRRIIIPAGLTPKTLGGDRVPRDQVLMMDIELTQIGPDQRSTP